MRFVTHGPVRNSCTSIEGIRRLRKYDEEIADTSDHKYAYDFDLDVMHYMMLRAFKPFLQDGRSLELGSFQGEFTLKLKKEVQHIECVEASGEAIKAFKEKKELHDVVCHHSLFENFVSNHKYDNIFLTHVLEHMDNPVELLSDIKSKWLSDSGRLFLVCPNANAPSRQLAVRMGLMSHNAAVTKSELAHGHRITYSFDTLERDVKKSGLEVLQRKGIFLKCLANFQWDLVIKNNIVSQEYLDACYDVGEIYPDLCSSIMLICE